MHRRCLFLFPMEPPGPPPSVTYEGDSATKPHFPDDLSGGELMKKKKTFENELGVQNYVDPYTFRPHSSFLFGHLDERDRNAYGRRQP